MSAADSLAMKKQTEGRMNRLMLERKALTAGMKWRKSLASGDVDESSLAYQELVEALDGLSK